MSELKFTCPICGQHMECEKMYSGDQTNCLNCNAELRIPFSHTPLEPDNLPHAELIVKHAQNASPSDHPKLDTFEPAPENKTAANIAPPLNQDQLHCICPVCQSDLEVSPGPFQNRVTFPQLRN